ncbi:MAG: tRNA (adenosine(37)-N6)-threonylcarbamoyltransferase complex dimerization subunit type 1 TsaB [Candidatus Saccharimonadales bacterium]
MIFLIDTSTPICKITLIDGDWRKNDKWEAGRTLAKGLLKHIQGLLSSCDKTWQDIAAIGAYEGPGSFTGLRIGLTVVNTFADAQNIPIVGARGDDWKNIALTKINDGKNEKIVLPFYGSEAHITVSRK